jgi:hypothetical protein
MQVAMPDGPGTVDFKLSLGERLEPAPKCVSQPKAIWLKMSNTCIKLKTHCLRVLSDIQDIQYAFKQEPW